MIVALSAFARDLINMPIELSDPGYAALSGFS